MMTSPVSTASAPMAISSFPEVHNDTDSSASSDTCSLTLDEFVMELPETIAQADPLKTGKGILDKKVSALFRRLVLDKEEWERFAFFDESKHYTRNLIASDGETFTLLLLCWTPGKSSPIHDHPCDGCWMRVCEGSVREARYVKNEQTDELRCTSDELYTDGQIAYITDAMGYHKVYNPSSTQPAVTLHMYSPPFESCKIWLDPSRASNPSNSCVCYYSEYGARV